MRRWERAVDREVGRVVATAGHPNDGSLNCEPGYPARGRFAPNDGSLNCEPGYPARGRFAPHDGSLNCEPGYPARGRFAPTQWQYTRRVGAEYVWNGESLVVLSAEEVDEIRRQLEEAAAYPER